MNSRAVSRLTGTRKAAILLAILGEEIASSVYRNLPENDLQMVTKEIAEMGSITATSGKKFWKNTASWPSLRIVWRRAEWKSPLGF